MCMIDACDGRVIQLHERHHKARKAHRCDECRREIEPGEMYLSERYIFEDTANTHKTCAHCGRVREWLLKECGGTVYSAMREDIEEHAREGGYGIDVRRMAVGMRRKWRRKDGRLLPLPHANNSIANESPPAA